MENKSFSFYRSFYESVKDIEDPEIQLSIYNAIFEYGLNGKEVKLSGLAKTIFTLIKPLLEANHKRRANGAKGGNAKANNKQKCSKSVANDNQSCSKDLAYKDKDRDKDKDTDSKRETAEAVVNLYHECCPSLPKVSKLNPMRIKLANARLKDYTMEDLKAIFIKAEHSDFLKNGRGTWPGANFDWILNQTNICKIDEGYYSTEEILAKEQEETRPVVGYILNDEYMMAPCYDQEEYERFMRERYGE